MIRPSGDHLGGSSEEDRQRGEEVQPEEPGDCDDEEGDAKHGATEHGVQHPLDEGSAPRDGAREARSCEVKPESGQGAPPFSGRRGVSREPL